MKGAAVMVAPLFKRKKDESIKNMIIYLEVWRICTNFTLQIIDIEKRSQQFSKIPQTTTKRIV